MDMTDALLVKHVLAFAAVFGLTMAGCAQIPTRPEPDAVYFNGKIVTLDTAESTAGGVAVKNGKILKVGSSDAIKKLAGTSTHLVDLSGKTVVPGLIDAHCHPMETIMMKGPG